MKSLGHLHVEEIKLPPGQEWADAGAIWRFVRVHSGAAYWLASNQNRPLADGETIVIPPAAAGVVRASQIGEVILHGFGFAPDLLFGFFTLSERKALETAATGATGKVHFFPSTHPVAQNFAALAAQNKNTNSLPQRVLVLSLVGAVFEEELSRHRPATGNSVSALHRFKQIIARMPDTEITHHAPEDLARLCGCSPRHFNRLFRDHFGISARDRQTELRLLKARQLLGETDDKIINIAFESGYRNLSLFNTLFKRHFGMTPSAWRRKTNKAFAKVACALVAATLFCVRQNVFAQDTGTSPAIATNATEKVSAAKSAGPTFEVKGYELDGNTLLPPASYEAILQDHIGPAVTFATIRDCLANLTIAYRVRGYSTVALSLPQQQLTNGIVAVKVTEGKIVAVKVTGNQFFSTRNVLRTLPSLKTNEVLNSILLQAELDRANGNRDRQIYPVVAPGPEPGTSVLELRVKDQRPLHARFEQNNYNTPGSPALRMNLSASYDNLWQREHQVGVQYSLTPEALKDNHYDYYPDAPLIASYSAFYRFPLGPVNGEPRAEDDPTPQTFGYDEATHKFNLPANSGRSEINIYASRSSSDSGKSLSSQTLTPPTVPPEGVLQVSDSIFGRTVSDTENLGFRLSKSLPDWDGLRSSVSAGIDFKSYRALSLQDRSFQATIFVPTIGNSGPPFTEFPSPPTASGTNYLTTLQYLPLTVGFNASRLDENGTSSFNLSQSINFAGTLSDKKAFQAVSLQPKTTGNYYIVDAGLTREQKFEGDWGVRLHADGQWANETLIGNEQFGLGGQAGVRGYAEGESYGDTGWRVQFEPHTPQFELGLVDDTEPMLARIYGFVDYGERYLLGNGVVVNSQGASVQSNRGQMCGAGAGVNATIGDAIDLHLQIAMALLDSPTVLYSASPADSIHAGDIRISFSVGAQF